jgi:cyclophilin family peptidyl-prolyl cis-trans isomerase
MNTDFNQRLQGGDIVDGSGANSPAKFRLADESFALKHDMEGVIAMVNKPLETNSASTQFYITLDALPWLDGRNVVFGRVVEGVQDTVSAPGLHIHHASKD